MLTSDRKYFGRRVIDYFNKKVTAPSWYMGMFLLSGIYSLAISLYNTPGSLFLTGLGFLLFYGLIYVPVVSWFAKRKKNTRQSDTPEDKSAPAQASAWKQTCTQRRWVHGVIGLLTVKTLLQVLGIW